MTDDTDDGPGRKPRITNQTVLDCFHETPDRCEPVTAAETADALDYHHNTARNHLEDLVFTGDMDSKQACPGKVYWLPCLPESGNDQNGLREIAKIRLPRAPSIERHRF